MVVQNIEPPRNLMTLTNLIGNFRGRELNKEPQGRNGNPGTMPFQPLADVNGGENSDSGEPPRNAAKALLICRPNSHPFQERTLILNQGVKIGRSVAKARPSPNNAIFDCKVLSRNHALMWYENGKFYLQDVKSSNGTFVNNQRLSKGSEESAPREICSGDIVQFGVDVVENTKRVTHGCIIATVKLFLPDGKEAKASSSTAVVSSFTGSVSLQDMHQLHHCIQEALRREEQLKEKMGVLQNLLICTNSSSQRTWKSLIDEDRLLTRVEILESQLQVYSKNFSEDKLRDELKKCHADKEAYQSTAKETLCNALQEKVELVAKLKDSERLASSHAEDLKYYKNLVSRRDLEMEALSDSYEKEVQTKQDLDARLRELEAKTKALEMDENPEADAADGGEEDSVRLNGVSNEEEDTTTKGSAHETEVDDVTEGKDLEMSVSDTSLSASCDSLATMIDGDRSLVNGFAPQQSVGVQVDQILDTIADNMDTDLRSALRQSEEELATLKEKLRLQNLESSEVASQKARLEEMYKTALTESEERLQKLQNIADENGVLIARVAEREAEIVNYKEKMKAVESASDHDGTFSNESAATEELKKLLAESREAKDALMAQFVSLRTELDEQIANRIQRESENAALVAKTSELEEERSRLVSSAANMNDELIRARTALEESEKEATAYKEQFLEKAKIAEETVELRDRIKSLEVELSAVKEARSSTSPLSGLVSSTDDAYVSLSSPNPERHHLADTSADLSYLNASCALSSSFDVLSAGSLCEELNTSKMELLQAKESYMKYHKLSEDLNQDNKKLRKELSQLKAQSQLASMSYTAVVVLVFGVFLGMALDSMYYSVNY